MLVSIRLSQCVLTRCWGTNSCLFCRERSLGMVTGFLGGGDSKKEKGGESFKLTSIVVTSAFKMAKFHCILNLIQWNWLISFPFWWTHKFQSWAVCWSFRSETVQNGEAIVAYCASLSHLFINRSTKEEWFETRSWAATFLEDSKWKLNRNLWELTRQHPMGLRSEANAEVSSACILSISQQGATPLVV